MSEVDDDQRAALRRLRAAFGPIEVIEVTSNDPGAAPDKQSNESGGAGGEPRVDDE